MKKPLRASGHCRHYSYKNGPRCALGVNISGGVCTDKCMPEPKAYCTGREEYTADEHTAWHKWLAWHDERGELRASGVVEPIACNTHRDYACPCGEGTARVQRGLRRVYMSCTCEVGHWEYNIGHENEWPSK